MKKILFQILLGTLLVTACGNEDDDNIDPITPIGTPTVQNASTYQVLFEEDITYAEGLSHQSINSTNATAIPLKLDVYQPNNELENRPVFVFIHGGGFIGGSKQQTQIVDLANYYTSRGWVFFSVDYRLRGNIGTVPQEWIDLVVGAPVEEASQFLAIYPAHRDAKAALRWVVANADTYKINTDYITVGGGSAGAITAITLGVSNFEDYRDEISIDQDPTLATTNLEQTYQIQTIVNFWGSKVGLDALELLYGHQRFDSNDPPLFTAHGTEDPTVLFSNAVDLKTIYETNGVPFAYYPLEGAGHGAWNAQVDGKRLDELAFEFIVEQQNLVVE